MSKDLNKLRKVTRVPEKVWIMEFITKEFQGKSWEEKPNLGSELNIIGVDTWWYVWPKVMT